VVDEAYRITDEHSIKMHGHMLLRIAVPYLSTSFKTKITID
jgi:hypothetical protein